MCAYHITMCHILSYHMIDCVINLQIVPWSIHGVNGVVVSKLVLTKNVISILIRKQSTPWILFWQKKLGIRRYFWMDHVTEHHVMSRSRDKFKILELMTFAMVISNPSWTGLTSSTAHFLSFLDFFSHQFFIFWVKRGWILAYMD